MKFVPAGAILNHKDLRVIFNALESAERRLEIELAEVNARRATGRPVFPREWRSTRASYRTMLIQVERIEQRHRLIAESRERKAGSR